MTAVICGIAMLVLLFADQITKAWAEAVQIHQGDYFLGMVRLFYTENTGMAFSMFDDNPAAMTVITVLTVVMIAGIAALFFTVFKRNKPAQAALAVIEAGAIGNLIDRLCLTNASGEAYVRDFIDVSPLRFGVCNLADFYITFAAVALIFLILFIGPDAVFPLKKKWREEAAEKEKLRAKNNG